MRQLERFLHSGLVLISAFFMMFFTGYPVSALSEELGEFFSINDIYYYDPDGASCDLEDIPGAFSSKPAGTEITWIGDSYTDGITKQYQIMSNKLTGVDVYAEVGKHFIQDDGSNKSGMTLLEEYKSSLRKYIVFALGTNDRGQSSEIEKAIKDIVDQYLGSDKTLILVTARTRDDAYSEVNEVIRQAAADYDNVIVADWAKAAKDNLDTYFDSDGDGVHPTKKGYQAWFDVIYNALPGGVATVDDTTYAGKIWNYLATAGVAGVSDNAAVIAGIMGNLQQESSLNPFNTSGVYYGLFQTDYADFKELVEKEVGVYWEVNTPVSSAPDEKIDQAIKVELDYLINKYKRFGIATPKDEPTFLDSLDVVSQQTPEAYAELFEVLEERAVTSDMIITNLIEDPGVLALSTKRFSTSAGGGKYYWSVDDRRTFARNFYNKYTKTSSSSKTTTTSASQTKTITFVLSKKTAEVSGKTILDAQQEQFVIDHYEVAQKLSVAYGIPWEAVVAQGILESASGTSQLAIDKHNYFGIGAYDSCPYECAFTYSTELEGWQGYYENIRKSATYRNHGVFSGNTITDPHAYLVAVKEAGYATAADYIEATDPLITAIEQLSSMNGWYSSKQLATNNPEMIEAAKQYANEAGSAPGSISSPQAEECVDSSGRSAYTGEGFPEYNQSDPRWGSLPLFSGASCTISSAGCGAASFAMMATFLTGREILPPEVAQLQADAGLINCEEGTYHNSTEYLAGKYGLSFKNLDSGSVSEAIKKVNEALDDGWLIHTSGSGSTAPFNGNHYIGIVGRDANGDWIIVDSGSHATHGKAFSPQALFNAGMKPNNIKAIK